MHSMSVSFGTVGALLHGMALVVALGGDFWGVTRDVVRVVVVVVRTTCGTSARFVL